MNYYWTYYALTLFAAYAVRNPWVCGVVVVLFLARPWLPDPVVLLRTFGRVGRLKTQARLNSANVIARRDLGQTYLDLNRPRAALRWLNEARERDPRNPEIAYLRGLALLRTSRYEDAVSSLAESVGVDPTSGEPFSQNQGRRAGSEFRRFDEAYLATATALEKLGRFEQAEAALMASSDCNSSLIEPLVRLARVRERRGDTRGSREARANARRTFHDLPGFMRRRQLGWGIRAYLG
jgi:tetratricopeptide (TPR) repeat protein